MQRTVEPIKIVLALALTFGIGYLAYLIAKNNEDNKTAPEQTGTIEGTEPGVDPGDETGCGQINRAPCASDNKCKNNLVIKDGVCVLPSDAPDGDDEGLAPATIGWIVCGSLLGVGVIMLGLYLYTNSEGPSVAERFTEYIEERRVRGQLKKIGKVEVIQTKAARQAEKLHPHFEGIFGITGLEARMKTATANGVPGEIVSEAQGILNMASNKLSKLEMKEMEAARKVQEKQEKAMRVRATSFDP